MMVYRVYRWLYGDDDDGIESVEAGGTDAPTFSAAEILSNPVHEKPAKEAKTLHEGTTQAPRL